MKISVITAVFNNRATIAAALDSVLAQTHSDVELVVIDGGSKDGTLDVLRAYGDRISILVSEPDDGIYAALNKGIDLASGEIVGFLHSDDLMADEHVLERVATAMQDQHVDAAYGDLLYVAKIDTTRVVRHWRAGTFSAAKLGRGWMPPHPTFYARRSLYARLGTFDITYRIAADFDCMLRFLKAPIRVAYIERVQVLMRMGGASNRSLSNIVTKSFEDLRALRKNQIGSFGALIWKNVSKIPQFFARTSMTISEGKAS